jgi:folate-dependent phosphoribosylglycinamide formyltransferase PurN
MRGVPTPTVFLGRPDSAVLAHLRSVERDVIAVGPSEPFVPEDPRLVISHGYRIILRRNVLDRLPRRVINLHSSLLPYNRGADPTLWSVLEDTPAGVTIHYIDEGVDTGDVIAQREVELRDDDTLATAYDTLQGELAALFREQWAAISAGTNAGAPQPPGGTVHRVADRAAVEHLLSDGWDTRVGALRGRCAAS